jgi:hypothetical protein
MTVTANDLVRKVRSSCQDWGKLTTTLTTTIDATGTTVMLDNMSDNLEEEYNLTIDLEVMRIKTIGTTLEVERGSLGTIATAHTAGVMVILEPRFSNEPILSPLNVAARKLVAYEPLIQVSNEGDFTYDSNTQEYSAPGGAISILKVDIEKGTGLYRPFYGYSVLDEFDPPVIRIPQDSSLRGKRFRVIYGSSYPDLTWDTPTTIPVKWHDFLCGYALGVVLENEDVANAALAQQTGTAGFRPGYAQQVGRNLQSRAFADLETLRPATRIIRRPDQRQYRR